MVVMAQFLALKSIVFSVGVVGLIIVEREAWKCCTRGVPSRPPRMLYRC